ncbi:ornithine decarboxylase-like [Asterias rubens]|uniref:ornithine decarboxylase-like n=1 Tax=Asterias rubens TaxID=7604 RepID=UPI0014550C0B|nr:ornithine decarboxylase-like [Asterias rubens]
MELFEAKNLKVSLYDKGTTIREIAAEKVKVQTDPEREELDDPFFIFDIGDVIAKDRQWRDLLPSVETFYAVKSNPDPVIVKLMLALGRGFECASKNEIQMVLDLGASPENVIFAHPYKQESHIRFVQEKGVRKMTFDTEEELYKVKRIYPGAELVLRIIYDSKTAMFVTGVKFGCHEEDVLPLLTLAKKLELDVVGVSFYIGTELQDKDVFEGVIQYVSPMFKLGRSLGLSMNLLDLGGGFPGRLRPKTPFEEFADSIKMSLAKHFPPSRGVRVVAEPGTFYTRSAGWLLANIMAKRFYKGPQGVQNVVQNGEGDVKNVEEYPVMMYYLNVGIYNSLLMSFLDQTYFDLPEPLKTSRKDADLKLSRLWGPTGDGDDVIVTRCMLPDMDAGDFLIISDAGGYTTTCATTFNGFCIPKTCYIAPQETRSVLEEAFPL